MRSPDESAVVARLPEPRPALLRRLKLRATLHIFILVTSLLLLAEQVAAAYVYPTTGRLPTFIKQSQQQPTSSASPAQNGREVRTLEAGKPIKRELAGGEAHFYKVVITAGQYMHMVVDRWGIDLALKMYAPDGQVVAQGGDQSTRLGPLHILLLGETTGNYRLEVRSFWLNKRPKKSVGHYRLKIEALRTPTPQDEASIRAERAYAEGHRLHMQPTARTLEQAEEKYREALSLIRGAADQTLESVLLYKMGRGYLEANDGQRSLPYFNQALSLF